MTEIWSPLSTMQPFLQEVWKKSGFTSPTAIQVQAIALALEGKDLIAESPTGSGKTLAYLLPLLHQIDTDKKNCQGLILAPSRELVMQIYEQIQKWTAGSAISAASFIGGADLKRQLEKLKKHPQLIVGTPGRILELIKLKKLKMHEVRSIVLDEGDQLLVPEHLDTLQQIVKSTLSDRQIMLFSATSLAKAQQIIQEWGNNPQLLRITQDEVSSSQVEHIYFICEHRDKIKLLERIVKLESTAKALAFVTDIGNMTVLAQKLTYNGLSLGLLHSDLKKTERETALTRFRTGNYKLLLSTDVAARGLDIEGVTHVIHVNLPENATQYVHRSGRTGRMGASGTVISLVTPREEHTLQKLSRSLGINLQKKVLFKGRIVDKR